MSAARLESMPPSPRQHFWSAQNRWAPYLFVLPFVVLFFSFLLYPLVQSAGLSFRQFAGPRVSRPAGVGNYAFVLRDPLFWLAVGNTAIFCVLFLLVEIPLSLGLAVLLNDPRVRGRALFRFAFFSPYLVGSVFTPILFALLLAPRRGLINQAIGAALPWVGNETNWRGTPALAMPAVVAAAVWLSAGQAMIYFLAALQSVDPALYEAAALDGAGRWGRFRHVTLPGVRPVGVYLVLAGTVYALQLFELPFLFFQGFGPQFRAMTVVGYLYTHDVLFGDLGTASAVGWILVALISVVAYVQLRATGAGQEL